MSSSRDDPTWRVMFRYRRYCIWFMVQAETKQKAIDAVCADAEFKKRGFVSRVIQENPDRALSVFRSDEKSMEEQEDWAIELIDVDGKKVPRQLDMYFDVAMAEKMTPAQKELLHQQDLRDATRIMKEMNRGEHLTQEERVENARKRRSQQILDDRGQLSEADAYKALNRAVIIIER